MVPEIRSVGGVERRFLGPKGVAVSVAGFATDASEDIEANQRVVCELKSLRVCLWLLFQPAL